jgi:hypothetical protein
VAASPPPAARDLLAAHRPGSGVPAHPVHPARHRGHAAGVGEPLAAGRGPRHGGPAVRRTAEPRRQHRPTDALAAREVGAVPGHRRSRGLHLRACPPAARDGPRRAGDRRGRDRGVRGVLRPGPAARSRTGGPPLVRRRQHALGPLGRAERPEPADQQRRHTRAGRPGRLPPRPGRADPDLPVRAPRRRPGAGVTRTGGHPDRLRDPGAARAVRRLRRAPAAAHARAAGAGTAAVRPGPHRAVGGDRRAAVGARRLRRGRRGLLRLPFTFGHADHVQILTDLATRLGPALGWSR